MKSLKVLTTKYLKEGKVIQLATSKDNVPWVCNVYYVVDKDLNVYWLSYPTRRHSQDIELNQNTAMSLAVKSDLPVIGIQMQGTAEKVKKATVVAKIMLLYVKKYGAGKNFYKNFQRGINKHAMYCFKPNKIVLFDEVNFGMNNAQEITF